MVRLLRLPNPFLIDLRFKSETARVMRSDKPRKWTEAEVQMLVKLANERVRSVEIARALERYLASVRRVARDMGIVLRG